MKMKSVRNMKLGMSNHSPVLKGIAVMILAACTGGAGQTQGRLLDNKKEYRQLETSYYADNDITDKRVPEDSSGDGRCRLDPNSPYWYDPNQENVDFSELKDTLLRFPRIKMGGDYVVPSSVRCIGERAFQGCRNLKTLTVPETVKQIEMAPFENCGRLERLTLHCQLDTLPFRFAGGCCSLRDIYLANEEPPFIESCDDEEEERAAFELNFYGINTDFCTIHVPRESASLYQNTPIWRLFKKFVEN